MKLLSNPASAVSPFFTSATTEVLLPSVVNVNPSTEIDPVFSSIVYLPTGRFSNVVSDPASTVKKTLVVPKDCLSACRY